MNRLSQSPLRSAAAAVAILAVLGYAAALVFRADTGSPNHSIRIDPAGPQGTVPFHLPSDWQRAPDQPTTRKNKLSDLYLPPDASDAPRESISLVFEAVAPSKFPNLFTEHLMAARTMCNGYADEHLRSSLPNLGVGTFMVILKCEKPAGAILLVFKEATHGMLTARRAHHDPTASGPVLTEDRRAAWLEWANTISLRTAQDGPRS